MQMVVEEVAMEPVVIRKEQVVVVLVVLEQELILVIMHHQEMPRQIGVLAVAVVVMEVLLEVGTEVMGH